MIPGIKTELKPHQLAAMNRAINSDLGLILAHDVGTGKTLTSLAIANMLGKPADVLVPASLMENYKKEIAKHTTSESVPFNLLSLQKFTKNPELLQPGNTLIVDEAHRLRNEKGKGYKLLESIPFNKKILMTGSPTYNSPVDLTSLVNLLDPEESQGNKLHSAGVRKYLTKTKEEIIEDRLKGISRLRSWGPELRRLSNQVSPSWFHSQDNAIQEVLNEVHKYPGLIERFPEYENVYTSKDFKDKFNITQSSQVKRTFHNMLKYLSLEKLKQIKTEDITKNYDANVKHYIEDHLKPKVNKYVDLYKNENVSDYPAKEEEIVNVGFDPDQEKEYNRYFDRMPLSLKSKILKGEVKNVLPSDLANPFFVKTRVISNMLNRTSPKINKMVEDLQDTNDKTIVYSNFLDEGLKPFAERLDKEGIKYNLFTGEMSHKNKQKAIEEYNSGKTNVLLISSAGGEGLDLKGTRLVQIMEPHFNQEKLNQVIGRAVRYQSHSHLNPEDRNVKIKYYITKSEGTPSTEEYLQNMSEMKLERNKKLTDMLKKSSLNVMGFMNGFLQGYLLEKNSVDSKAKKLLHPNTINKPSTVSDQISPLQNNGKQQLSLNDGEI